MHFDNLFSLFSCCFLLPSLFRLIHCIVLQMPTSSRLRVISHTKLQPGWQLYKRKLTRISYAFPPFPVVKISHPGPKNERKNSDKTVFLEISYTTFTGETFWEFSIQMFWKKITQKCIKLIIKWNNVFRIDSWSTETWRNVLAIQDNRIRPKRIHCEVISTRSLILSSLMHA